MKNFINNCLGNMAVLGAVSLAGLTGVIGAAVLSNQGNDARDRLQAGVDAAVLAGTSLGYGATADERIAAAQKIFDYNIKLEGASLTSQFSAGGVPVPSFTVNGATVTGTSNAKLKNSLGTAIGISSLKVNAFATAEKMESGPVCVLTLNQSNSSNFYVYGNAQFSADCAVQANSNSNSAMEIAGNKSIATATMFGVTGGVSGNGWSNPPVTGTNPIVDPYADLKIPAPGACTAANTRIQKTSGTLDPGTYCGGLDVKAGGSVTLNPGIYIILDGQLRVGSGASLVGREVVLALVGADSYFYFSAGAQVKVTSPVSGEYKNMQFISDRDLSKSKFNVEWSTMLSGADLEFDGAMYLPEQQLWVSGTSGDSVFRAYSPSMAVVVDTLWNQGNAVMEVHHEDRRNIGAVSGDVQFQYGARLTN